MRGVGVIFLFVFAAVIFGGTGFLVQAAANKSAKSWPKLILPVFLLCATVFMIAKPTFFFYWAASAFAFLGAAAALAMHLIKKRKA